MAAKTFVSEPIALELGPDGLDFYRADIEFHGVEQAGPSFEARVFLNNPQADARTPATSDNGYAGAFHVYGYGVWPGPAEAAEAAPADPRAARAPMTRSIVATGALRAAARQGREVVVTVVPVLPETAVPEGEDVLKIQKVAFVVRTD